MEHQEGCPCGKYSLGFEEIWVNNKVDFESLRCFNEEKQGSCKKVFEPNGGLCFSPEDDPELIFVIRMKEPVALKSIVFINETEKDFEYMGLYINKENVSLDIIEENPV